MKSCTHPVERGRGRVRALMAAGEQRIRDRGLTWATLSVEVDNDAARALYERLGYDADGVGEDSWKAGPDGDHVPLRLPGHKRASSNPSTPKTLLEIASLRAEDPKDSLQRRTGGRRTSSRASARETKQTGHASAPVRCDVRPTSRGGLRDLGDRATALAQSRDWRPATAAALDRVQNAFALAHGH